MLPILDGETRLHFIIGDPVGQTRSPAGLTREFAARKVNAICVPVPDVDAARRDRLVQRLAARAPAPAPAVVRAGTADPAGFGLVVNATPAGMRPADPLPVDVARLESSAVVADLITRPAMTPLLE